MSTQTDYRTLAEFYPYYLSEHSNRTCRRLHFVGSSLALAMSAYALFTQQWHWIAIAFVQGYAARRHGYCEAAGAGGAPEAASAPTLAALTAP